MNLTNAIGAHWATSGKEAGGPHPSPWGQCITYARQVANLAVWVWRRSANERLIRLGFR